jgi:hypothetical protein
VLLVLPTRGLAFHRYEYFYLTKGHGRISGRALFLIQAIDKPFRADIRRLRPIAKERRPQIEARASRLGRWVEPTYKGSLPLRARLTSRF